jgi:hypothetical protein
MTGKLMPNYFKKWFHERFLLYFAPEYVIAIGNMSYYSAVMEKSPTAGSNVVGTIAWMFWKNVPYTPPRRQVQSCCNW